MTRWLPHACALLVCITGLSRAGAQTPEAAAPATTAPAAAPTTAPAAAPTTAATPAAPAAEPTVAATTSTPSPAPAADDGSADQADEHWVLRNRRFNTVGGATGGIHVVDPGTGAPGSVRTQVALDFFSGSDFLYDDDRVEQNGQAITVGWTPTSFLELYSGLFNRGTASTRDARSLHVLGDMVLGIKLGGHLTETLRLGGDVNFGILNAVGASDTLLEATGIGLRTSAALDLTQQPDPIPFIARLNLGYYFDNSGSIVEDVEDAKRAELDSDDPNETRHFIDRFERLGLAVNRVDLLTMAAGVEFPIAFGEDTALHPIAEWRFSLPINRQDYSCPFRSSDQDRGTPAGMDDTCVDDAGAGSFPMTVTVAARLAPPVRGLSAMFGIDLGITGTDKFVRELVPNMPYRVWFGLGYDFDARPEAPAPVPTTNMPAPVAQPAPRLTGTVVDSETGAPIAGALLTLVDQDLPVLATNDAGKFVGHELPTGPVTLSVSHPDYETAMCNAAMPADGSDAQAACQLTPTAVHGALMGRLVDAYGSPIANGQISLSGPAQDNLATDTDGRFVRKDLPPGDYVVRVAMPSHMLRSVDISVPANGTAQVTVSAPALSSPPAVTLTGETLTVEGLSFASNTDRLTADGMHAAAELADYLLRHPEVLAIQVSAPGPSDLAVARAQQLKKRLLAAGVDGGRIATTHDGTARETLEIKAALKR